MTPPAAAVSAHLARRPVAPLQALEVFSSICELSAPKSETRLVAMALMATAQEMEERFDEREKMMKALAKESGEGTVALQVGNPYLRRECSLTQDPLPSLREDVS